ncbi:MAG: TonB-dependent receptor [Bacteroidales bacterium]|nr:TonB-dependent receptor [Bacteroidales bacterium]
MSFKCRYFAFRKKDADNSDMNLRLLFLICAFVFALSAVAAQEVAVDDTMQTIELKEVLVYSRENQELREQPLSYNVVSSNMMARQQITRMPDLTALVPNFYMPEYGSKITSSMFLRGIGARTNDPSVGLYVDNVPILDKSLFDFSFLDLKIIDVLRGPQGTLYGRNSIGGLIRVSTLSPFEYQGVKAQISYGSYNDLKARLSYYHKIKEKLAFSFGGFYDADDGSFRNVVRNERNSERTFGGRTRWEWRMTDEWLANFSLSYENVSQNAYPYALYDAENDKAGDVAYDAPGKYDRDALTASLSFQKKTEETIVTSTTSFQYLNDKMRMDQDFSPDSIFRLTQCQNSKSLTQEFTFRSTGKKPYQHVCGVMGFAKWNEVDAPMTLYQTGFRTLVPNMPAFVSVDDDIYIPGLFNLRNFGSAIYHQSSYTFWDKLTFTLGLRFDYERAEIDYNTSASLSATAMGIHMNPVYKLKGNDQKDFWTLLPKFSAKYDFSDRYMLYASIAKGYKAGGYSFSMLSNTLQEAMKHAKDNIFDNEVILQPLNSVSYKPEYTWNYEIGLHAEPVRSKLFMDVSAYFIRFNDQQIVTYAENGSRMVSNAARSQNYGAELTMRANPAKDFRVGLSYGFLVAKFKEYEYLKTAEMTMDFAGNHLPFAPGHTFALSAEYKVNVDKKLLDNIIFSAQYNGAGQIYFSEKNDVMQKYYGVLNAKIALRKKGYSLSIWIKNATNAHYYTFYCESLNKSYVQLGNPFRIGAAVTLNL